VDVASMLPIFYSNLKTKVQNYSILKKKAQKQKKNPNKWTLFITKEEAKPFQDLT
jgi:hypothetical protein